MSGEQPPERRLRLDLTLHADDLHEVATSLLNIARDLEIEGREERERTSGGYRSGHTLELTVTDPDMDGDRYRAELSEWVRRRREMEVDDE